MEPINETSEQEVDDFTLEPIEELTEQNYNNELSTENELNEFNEIENPVELNLPELEPLIEEGTELLEEQPEAENHDNEYNVDTHTEEKEDVVAGDFATLDDIAKDINFTEQTSAETSNEDSSEEDMSGLEEFTMDMAAAYEQANPDTFNPKRNIENKDVSMEFNEDDFNMMSSSTTVENQFIEEIDTDKNSDFNTDLEAFESINTSIGETELNTDSSSIEFENFNTGINENESQESFSSDNQIQPNIASSGDFEFASQVDDNSNKFDANIEKISFDNLTTDESSHLEDINLDELDNFDDDDEFSYVNSYNNTNNEEHNSNFDSEIDNIVNNPNFDIDEINIDDIDLNNPNLNIENIDIDMSDINIDDISSIENIPDISESPQDVQIQPQEEQIQQQEEYIPNFNENDQNTIETLYEDNTQSQPGEAINQSLNVNNVNNNVQSKPQQKKKTSPLLGILLIVLIGAFGFMKKDLIIEKINAQKGVTLEQDQNMPIEGESQEDKDDAKLLNDENNSENENQEEQKQGIGDIPGEAGGPQDAASMEQSLHQKGSMVNTLPNSGLTKTPEPLLTSNIKRLYWEVPQDLTYNADIVNYLKTVGKTMKFAIQSDLLNTSEMPYSNKMIVDIVIKKDGTIEKVNTTVSSGSSQIDSIVLQSVNAAIKYVKAPTAEFKNDSYNFSLIINF